MLNPIIFRIRGVAFGIAIILIALIAPRFLGVVLQQETTYWYKD